MTTDPLLDEATRLADRLHDVDPPEVRVLRALVERVRAAEAERDSWKTRASVAAEEMLEMSTALARVEFLHQGCEFIRRKDVESVLSQRDSARGKLDAVRAWLDDVYDDGTEWRDLRRLRAILDGDNGR